MHIASNLSKSLHGRVRHHYHLVLALLRSHKTRALAQITLESSAITSNTACKLFDICRLVGYIPAHTSICQHLCEEVHTLTEGIPYCSCFARAQGCGPCCQHVPKKPLYICTCVLLYMRSTEPPARTIANLTISFCT